MLSHLLCPGSTLWHSPASGTHIPRNSEWTWTWGLVPVQDLLLAFVKAELLHTCTVISCSCPSQGQFCSELSIPISLLFSAVYQENEYSGVLEPEFKYPALWAGLVADIIHFTSFPSIFKPNPHLSHAIAVQAKNIIIKNWLGGSSLRMRWNFSRKDQALGFLLGTVWMNSHLQQWQSCSAGKGRVEMSGCCSGEAFSEQQHHYKNTKWRGFCARLLALKWIPVATAFTLPFGNVKHCFHWRQQWRAGLGWVLEAAERFQQHLHSSG